MRPDEPSWMMNPVVGTVWFTWTGVTHRSATRCSTSSTSARYLTTGTSACGIFEKSGQRTLLKTLHRSVLTTGSMPVTVTAAPVSQKPSVSLRYTRPAIWSRCECEISAYSIESCSGTVSALDTVPASISVRSLMRNAEGRCPSPSPPKAPRSEEHTSELQSLTNLVCRLLLEKKKNKMKLRCSQTQTLTANRGVDLGTLVPGNREHGADFVPASSVPDSQHHHTHQHASQHRLA